MKRGRPMTPTPSASTERSRKSREKAAEKARKQKIIEQKEKIIDKHRPRPFAMIPLPTEPIAMELSLHLGRRTKGGKPDSWAELRRRRRQKD
jgi:hypothetical protein